MALEAEVTRLDHAGVYGPDGDFVDLLSSHPVEVHHAHGDRGLAGTSGWEAHRLEPGVALGQHPGALVQVPLKEVGGGQGGGQRGVARLGDWGPAQPQQAGCGVDQHAPQGGLRAHEQGCQSRSRSDLGHDGGLQLLHGQGRDALLRQRGRVVQGQQGAAHRPST